MANPPSTTPRDPLRSARLLYRAVEYPDDVAFFHDLFLADAITTGAGLTNYLQPRSKQLDDDLLKRIQGGSMMAAIICLPPSETEDSPATSTTAVPAPANDKEAAAPATPKKPIPIGFLRLSAAGGPEDVINRRSTISIFLTDESRGKGYGSEAIEWSLYWGFRFANLHKISISTVSYNPGAMRLYDRLFPRREAVRKDQMWWDGGWHDVIEWAILEDEWRARQAERQGV